jgi:putative ABC transport system substrate-binding protein
LRRIGFVVVLALSLLAPLVAPAQQTARIGYLPLKLDTIPRNRDAFRQGLRDLGYVEGRNLVIEYRDAEGKPERLAAGAAELVALNVKSLARPGGNVTGLSNLTPDLIGKCMQLLKEAVPGATRVAVLTHPSSATAKTDKDYATRAQTAGRSLGFVVQLIDAGRPVDLDRAFAEMTRWHANALVVMSYATLLQERTRIMALAAKQRLPAVYAYRENVMEGGLMSYGPDLSDQFRRSAAYVDRILKGAMPGDLPIEQPTKFELLINLKTAKALGLTIPQSMLLRADEIIQ